MDLIIDRQNQVNMYHQVIIACICEKTIAELYDKASQVSLAKFNKFDYRSTMIKLEIWAQVLKIQDLQQPAQQK